MKTYLVGGAVRDKLLGLPVVDRDWVVVGETPDAMLAAGYTPVGKDFPVFLHPDSHEEYALARTERKTGPGYQGFQFDTDVSVTLEEDLLRRDLTINAIAQDHNGKLIDPFRGQKDIEARVFRHVSPAFAEDPVRVLRIARFMARFSHLGFTVADATLELMRSMVASGEVDNLVPERVWRELESSLAAITPRAFFTTLMAADALAPSMPELNEALQQPARLKLETLDAACALSDNACIRFAAFCSDFTAMHAASLAHLCDRLRIPSRFTELALLCARHTKSAHQCLTLDATQLHGLLKSLDWARRPERFDDFLLAASASASATDNLHGDYPQAAHLLACAQAMGSVNAAQIAKSQANKSTISTAIKQHEIAAIQHYLNT